MRQAVLDRCSPPANPKPFDYNGPQPAGEEAARAQFCVRNYSPGSFNDAVSLVFLPAARAPVARRRHQASGQRWSSRQGRQGSRPSGNDSPEWSPRAVPCRALAA